MKEKIVVNTRWQYYVANVGGLFVVIGLSITLLRFAISDEGIDFASIYLWMALVLLITVPFAIISFFSSMKSVEVTAKELTISYVFQKHRNVIRFSEVSEMRAQRKEGESLEHPRSMRDTFALVLADGRVFEFGRSQFDRYGTLKSICWKKVKG